MYLYCTCTAEEIIIGSIYNVNGLFILTVRQNINIYIYIYLLVLIYFPQVSSLSYFLDGVILI